MSTTTTTGPPSSSSAEASSSYQTTAHSYRLCLERAVAAILVESGFDTATSTAVQTLSELLQSFMYELGRSSRDDCNSWTCLTDVKVKSLRIRFRQFVYINN